MIGWHRAKCSPNVRRSILTNCVVYCIHYGFRAYMKGSYCSVDPRDYHAKRRYHLNLALVTGTLRLFKPHRGCCGILILHEQSSWRITCPILIPNVCTDMIPYRCERNSKAFIMDSQLLVMFNTLGVTSSKYVGNLYLDITPNIVYK